MLNIQAKEIYPNIIHMKFQNKFELTSSLLRFSEFVESPFKEIHGKFFTYETYMQVYSEHTPHKQFSYFTDWSGFNIKGDTFKIVSKLFKKDLWEREKQVLEFLTPWSTRKSKFYVIATSVTDDKNTSLLKHEVAHAMYYLNKSYFAEQEKNLTLLKKSNKTVYKSIENKLANVGYGKEVIRDEIQAYLSTSDNKYLKNFFSDSYKFIDKGKLHLPFSVTLDKYL